MQKLRTLKPFLHYKILIPLSSFIVFLSVVGYFVFRDSPPQLPPGILGSTRSGVLRLEIEPPVQVEVPFKMNVIMDTQNQSVNAVGLYLNFEPDNLEIIDFDTSESFCQFYPEKRFDNTLGTFSLSCGSPHPGFSGVGTIATITFFPKVVTSTTIQVDPKSLLLLSDGKGTNILNDFPFETIGILNAL